MKLSPSYLRSVQGQMSLFGVVFVGGVVLAVAAVCLRDRLFAPFVREKYPPLDDELAARAREEAPADLDRLGPGELEQLYGAWIEIPDLDADGRLARRLAEAQGRWLLPRLRRTLVVGNAAQRGRALDWLLLVPLERSAEAVELARAARARAARRKEEELLHRADVVLEKLSPPPDEP
jgi:hypothetical protein